MYPINNGHFSFSKGFNVLLMDDDELIRALTGAMLNHLGHSVETVESGENAVSLYRARRDEGRPFDVVILDVFVPGSLGGPETLVKIMEIDPSVKAIVSSGNTREKVITNYREYGFRSSLPKPYGVGQLGMAIEEAIGRGPGSLRSWASLS